MAAPRRRMRRLRCHQRHERLSVRMAVEQMDDVPVLEFQEGTAEHVDHFTVPAIKEDVVEVIQLLLHDCIQGRLAEQMVDFAVPPIKEELAEASAPGAHPRAHCGADSGTLRAEVQGENSGGVSGSAPGAHPRGADSGTRAEVQGENSGGVSGSASGAHPRAHR